MNEDPPVVAASIMAVIHRAHQLAHTDKGVQIFELEHTKELQSDLGNMQEHAAQPDCPEDE